MSGDLVAAGVPLLVSAAVAAALMPGALRAFGEAGWTRANYRGRDVAFPAGVVAVVAALAALATVPFTDDGAEYFVLFDAPYPQPVLTPDDPTALAFAPLFLGVAFLGLLDDLFEGAPRGWRGHFASVLRGGFSTGVLKALGTLALAVLVVAEREPDAGRIALSVAVIALATNFLNLLDLRPGRAWKAYIALTAALVVADGIGPIEALGPFAGALLVVGLFDLRERAMLGDTGSNLLGALAGVHLVLALGTTGELIALGVLLVLTIFGEFRSISATVDRLPPLRGLDSLGRRDA